MLRKAPRLKQVFIMLSISYLLHIHFTQATFPVERDVAELVGVSPLKRWIVFMEKIKQVCLYDINTNDFSSLTDRIPYVYYDMIRGGWVQVQVFIGVPTSYKLKVVCIFRSLSIVSSILMSLWCTTLKTKTSPVEKVDCTLRFREKDTQDLSIHSRLWALVTP